MNVPIGLALLVLCRVLLRESRNPSLPRAFDVAGAVTVTLALVLLVYGITEAPAAGWASPRTWAVFAASAALLAAFLVIEHRSSAPLVPLRIFRSRRLVGGNIVLLVAGMSVDGVLFILTLYAQRVLGASAEQFGLMTAVLTVMSVVGSFAGQFVVTKRGFRPVASSGRNGAHRGGQSPAGPVGSRWRTLPKRVPRADGLRHRTRSGLRRRADRGALGGARRRTPVWPRASPTRSSRSAERWAWPCCRRLPPRVPQSCSERRRSTHASPVPRDSRPHSSSPSAAHSLGLMAALILLGSHRRTTPASGEVASRHRRGLLSPNSTTMT